MIKKLKKRKIRMFSSFKYLFTSILAIIICVAVIYTVVRAGDLEPSASPAATMHSLLEMAAKDISNTFNRATDSLEALSESILTRAPSNTALSTTTWTTTKAGYLDFLSSDLKFLVSSSTASTTPFTGSMAYHIGTSTVATSTNTLFGWFKNIYDYMAPSSTALTTGTWTDARAGYLDAIIQPGYSSTTISADIDGNILERLEYLNNRNMFSVVNIKNGSAGANVADYASSTQAVGGVDDYNNSGTRPTDSFAASWTECTAGNNYCKTGDSNADYQDNNTGLIWSNYLDGGANHTWFWANNCWEPGTWANPDGGEGDNGGSNIACDADGDDACQCVKATSTPNMTGCEALGDGGWRLSHQKELMQAYIDGSWGNLSNAANTFWSATTLSGDTHYAWHVSLYSGYTNGGAKTLTYDSRCVR